MFFGFTLHESTICIGRSTTAIDARLSAPRCARVCVCKREVMAPSVYHGMQTSALAPAKVRTLLKGIPDLLDQFERYMTRRGKSLDAVVYIAQKDLAGWCLNGCRSLQVSRAPPWVPCVCTSTDRPHPTHLPHDPID